MNTLSQIFQNIFSDNSNIMLAAIISLLLVILFVLLLHLYAKWFLAQAQAQSNARRRHRRRRAATVTVSDVLGPARFHHFHSFNIEDSPIFPSTSSSSHHNTSKGLDSSIIAGIPLFIYTTTTTTNSEVENNDEKVLEHDEELECVICLSSFIDGEMGRCLPKCGHGFHVECIDMWLSSHSNCPICRAPIILSSGIVENNDNSQLGSVIDDGIAHDDHVDDGGSSGFVEIVVDDFGQSSEIRENNENGGRVSSSSSDSSSVSSETETSTSLVIVGCSLKRMLSKVFPSSNNVNVNELQT